MDDKKKMLREMTCCFTGHRLLEGSERLYLSGKLRDTVEELIASGVRYFGAGGALGFDTMAAQTVLFLKRDYPDIRLILVLPCEEQADKWSEGDRQVYEAIKEQADKVRYISKEYTRDCMLRRNRHLVDNSGVCVCYLRKKQGGTAYTVDYARRQGVPVINLAPNTTRS